MAVFHSDTFADANGTALTAHTGEVGATWTQHPTYSGARNIQDNRCYSPDAFNGAAYSSGIPGGAEYDLVTIFRAVTNAGAAGIVGRMATADATGYWLAHDSNVWTLYLGPGFSTLFTFGWTPSVGVDYEIKLEIRDATKKLFIDGIERGSSTDNGITAAGRVGLYSNTGSSTTGKHFDVLTGTDLTGAAASLPPRRNPYAHLIGR